MKGQEPINGKCRCDKCGKTMVENQFYTYPDKSKDTLCKQCKTLHVDNFDPETYLWILEDFDVPYIPSEWNVLRDKAFAADPKKINGMSVIGRYLAKMKLKQWKNYTWADSEYLQKQDALQRELAGKPQVGTEEERMAWESQVAALKEQLENGEISKAQYETLMPTEVLSEEMAATTTEEAYEEANSNMFNETHFMSEDELPDPAAQLTEDDKIALAMKWGRLYKPSEWVELERLYNDWDHSFDIQDADTKNTLILICKTNLKINQAMDIGDMDGVQKLTRVYDSLRKSAKFTAAQNKGDKADYVDSVGELVAMCEREEGFIPRWVTDVPQDKVDYALKDMNRYVYNLVTKDLGFGQQIENYIKKIELEREAEKAMEQSDDELTIDIEDQDVEEYYEDLEEQKDKDNDITPESNAYEPTIKREEIEDGISGSNESVS